MCAACGAKVLATRERCPRCGAALARPNPALAAAKSRKLSRAAGALAVLFLLIVAALWFMREPTAASPPSGPVVDPLSGRRQAAGAPAQPAAAPVAAKEGMNRPFLDAAGAGYTAYASGDYASSLQQYMLAIEKNPNDAESLSNLGQVLVRLNRTAEAIPYFQRAVALIPNRWAYQFNLARAFGLMGRADESISGYRRAQQLFPDDYVTTFNLALALHKQGDAAGAVDQYEKAIVLQPEDASFRKALGVSLEQLRRGPEAAAAYQEYLRLSPTAPEADMVRARIAELTAGSASAAPPLTIPPALLPKLP
jgi:tetratricopeptide (TPR) repeat protein